MEICKYAKYNEERQLWFCSGCGLPLGGVPCSSEEYDKECGEK